MYSASCKVQQDKGTTDKGWSCGLNLQHSFLGVPSNTAALCAPQVAFRSGDTIGHVKKFKTKKFHKAHFWIWHSYGMVQPISLPQMVNSLHHTVRVPKSWASFQNSWKSLVGNQTLLAIFVYLITRCWCITNNNSLNSGIHEVFFHFSFYVLNLHTCHR